MYKKCLYYRRSYRSETLTSINFQHETSLQHLINFPAQSNTIPQAERKFCSRDYEVMIGAFPTKACTCTGLIATHSLKKSAQNLQKIAQ